MGPGGGAGEDEGGWNKKKRVDPSLPLSHVQPVVIDLDDANRTWCDQIPQGIKDDQVFWATIKQRVCRLKSQNVRFVGAFDLLRPVQNKIWYGWSEKTRIRYAPTKVHDIDQSYVSFT